MDDNTLLIIGGLGLFFWYQTKNGSNNNYNPTSDFVATNPPPTSQNPAQWAEWAALAVSLYGVVADLWAPGGPFHNTDITPEDANSLAAGGGLVGAVNGII